MKLDTNSIIESLLIYTVSFGTTLLILSFIKKINNLINNNQKNENNFVNINFYENAPLRLFCVFNIFTSILFNNRIIKIRNIYKPIISSMVNNFNFIILVIFIFQIKTKKKFLINQISFLNKL